MSTWAARVTVLLSFIVLRMVDLLLFAQVAYRDGHTPIDLMLSWDGAWYQRAITAGWPPDIAPLADGTLPQSTWAWPPLFPMIGHLVGAPFTAGSQGLVLIGVNFITGALAALVLYESLRPHLAQRGAVLVSVAWAAMPAAPVFLMAYAEGPFMLLLFGAAWAAMRQRFVLAGAILLIAGLTKSSVLPYAVALVIVVVLAARGRNAPRVAAPVAIIATALAVIAVLAWPVIVALSLGRLDAYGQVQAAWGRSTIPGRDTLVALWGLIGDVGVDNLAAVLMTGASVVVAVLMWRDERFPLFMRLVGVTSPIFLLATGAALSSARLLLPDTALPAQTWRCMRGTPGIIIVLVVLTAMRWAWISLYVSGVPGDPPP